MIYFIQNQRTLALKIGFSDNVRARYRSLKTASSDYLRLVGVIPGGRGFERDLHETFALQRLAGEWFSVDPELAALIAGFLVKRGGGRPRLSEPPSLADFNDVIGTASSAAANLLMRSTDLRFSVWLNPIFDHRSTSADRAFFAVITIRSADMEFWGEVEVHPADEFRDVETRIAEVVAEMDAGRNWVRSSPKSITWAEAKGEVANADA